MIVSDDLKGRFHVHLTLACDEFNEKIHSWKTTVISLTRDKHNQLDVMLTKHYYIPSNKTECLQDIKNDISKAVAEVEKLGYQVLRVKLEHEDLPTLKPSKENYRECHIKIEIPKGFQFELPSGWVKSKNPIQQKGATDVFFLNKRWYDSYVDEIENQVLITIVRLTKKGISILEHKQETIVFDSTKGLDAWWA